MLAVINSVLGGAFVGLLVTVLVAQSLALATGTSIVIFLLSLFVHQRYQRATYKRTDQETQVLFPTPTNLAQSGPVGPQK
jgi:Na+/proline symporter